MVRSLSLLVLLVSVSFANIGKIVALKGNVDVVRDNKTTNGIKSGFKLEKNDMLKTGPKAKLQIVFSDQTVITIGKKSEFKVYDYFYKEGNKKPKASFGFLKGSFKSVTGNIGKIAKNRFKLKTKTASMGIRGTTIVGQVSDTGDKIACTDGAIVVTSLTTGVTVPVPAGKITTVKKGANPTPARNYSPAEITSMENDTVEETKETNKEEKTTEKETKEESQEQTQTEEEKTTTEETTVAQTQTEETTTEETTVTSVTAIETVVQDIVKTVESTNNEEDTSSQVAAAIEDLKNRIDNFDVGIDELSVETVTTLSKQISDFQTEILEFNEESLILSLNTKTEELQTNLSIALESTVNDNVEITTLNKTEVENIKTTLEAHKATAVEYMQILDNSVTEVSGVDGLVDSKLRTLKTNVNNLLKTNVNDDVALSTLNKTEITNLKTTLEAHKTNAVEFMKIFDNSITEVKNVNELVDDKLKTLKTNVNDLLKNGVNNDVTLNSLDKSAITTLKSDLEAHKTNAVEFMKIFDNSITEVKNVNELVDDKLRTLKTNVNNLLKTNVNDDVALSTLNKTEITNLKTTLEAHKTNAVEFMKIFDESITTVANVNELVDDKLRTLKTNVNNLLKTNVNDDVAITTLDKTQVTNLKTTLEAHKTNAVEYMQIFDESITTVANVNELVDDKLSTLQTNVETLLLADITNDVTLEELDTETITTLKSDLEAHKTKALEYIQIIDNTATSVESVNTKVETKLYTLKTNITTLLVSDAHNLDTTVPNYSGLSDKKSAITDYSTTALDYIKLVDGDATSVTQVDTIVDTKLTEFYENAKDRVVEWIGDNFYDGPNPRNKNKMISVNLDDVNTKLSTVTKDYYNDVNTHLGYANGDENGAKNVLAILPENSDYATTVQQYIDDNIELTKKLKVIKYKVDFEYYKAFSADDQDVELADIRNINKNTKTAVNTDYSDTIALANELGDEYNSLISDVDFSSIYAQTSQKAVKVLKAEIYDLDADSGQVYANGDFKAKKTFNKRSKTIDYYANKIKGEVISGEDCKVDGSSCSSKSKDLYNSIEATYKDASVKLVKQLINDMASDKNNVEENILNQSATNVTLDNITATKDNFKTHFDNATSIKNDLHSDSASNFNTEYKIIQTNYYGLKVVEVLTKVESIKSVNGYNGNSGYNSYVTDIKNEIENIKQLYSDIKSVYTDVADYGEAISFKFTNADGEAITLVNENINEQAKQNMRDLDEKITKIVTVLETDTPNNINGAQEDLANIAYELTTIRQGNDITHNDALVKAETLKDDDDNAYLELGFWKYSNEDNGKRNFSWISGTKTAEEKIQNLIDNKQKATYNGKVYGTVITDKAMEQIDSANSKVNMNFDFGNKNVDGSMKFQTANTNWQVGFDKGTVNKSGFGVTEFTSNHTGNIEGSYYGTKAVTKQINEDTTKTFDFPGAVGGRMKIQDNESNIAVGSFSATQK
jgi:hypothetical protein